MLRQLGHMIKHLGRMLSQLGRMLKQLERHVQQLGCMLNSSDKLRTVLLNGCKALRD